MRVRQRRHPFQKTAPQQFRRGPHALRLHHQFQFPRQAPGPEVLVQDVHVEERERRRRAAPPARQHVQPQRRPGPRPGMQQEQAGHGRRLRELKCSARSSATTVPLA